MQKCVLMWKLPGACTSHSHGMAFHQTIMLLITPVCTATVWLLIRPAHVLRTVPV